MEIVVDFMKFRRRELVMVPFVHLKSSNELRWNELIGNIANFLTTKQESLLVISYQFLGIFLVWFSNCLGNLCHHRWFHGNFQGPDCQQKDLSIRTHLQQSHVSIRGFQKGEWCNGNFFPSQPFWETKCCKISCWIYNWFIPPVTQLLVVSHPGQLLSPPSPTKRCNCDISKMARVPSKAATRPFSEQPYGQATLEMLPEKQGRNSPKPCPQWKRIHNKFC